ncbi:MAG: T9SS type A sorting domain-containing protein [bacterium]
MENTITEFALSEITGQITCDGFEQYDVPSGWMANWHGSGNVSGIAVDNTTAATGANSMHMFGILGGCWAAVATRPLQMDLPMEITFSVKNGDEDLYGCNPYRGALGLRTGGPDWWNCPCFAFVLFLENGDVRIPVPSGAVEFTGYPLGVWHHVKCQLINPDDGFLHVKIWINQGYLGEFYWPFESWMTGSAYLDIESLEGTAWFDDICVSEPLIDTLYLPPHKGCLASKDMTSVVLPLKVKNQTEITAINIPLKWNNANLILDSISHVGTATENWSNNHVIKNDSQRIVIGSLDISGSLPILSGWDTTVALLYFRYTGTQCAYDSLSIAFDTTYSDNEQWKLAFGDNSNPPNEFYPEFSSSDALIYTLKPGDVNMNCGVNILDASYLIFYLYKGGVVPNPLFMGDVNCNGNINILDVSYLLAFLYKNGPAPVCCVPGMSLSTPPKQCACVKGERSVPGGTITLTSESGQNALVLRNSIGLSGLELILKATNRETVELKSAIDGIELHWSQNGDEIRAALIDLSGLATIDAGERKIIEVIGDIEIVSVLGADENSNGVSFEIVNQATKEELLPKVYSLEQNRPNPFNPATTIEFSLPRASDVSLEVYNIAGQKIATLVNTRLEAGNHTVNWDSKSTSGEPLASGIYLYRLKADTFVETKKMVLLK